MHSSSCPLSLPTAISLREETSSLLRQRAPINYSIHIAACLPYRLQQPITAAKLCQLQAKSKMVSASAATSPTLHNLSAPMLVQHSLGQGAVVLLALSNVVCIFYILTAGLALSTQEGRCTPSDKHLTREASYHCSYKGLRAIRPCLPLVGPLPVVMGEAACQACISRAAVSQRPVAWPICHTLTWQGPCRASRRSPGPVALLQAARWLRADLQGPQVAQHRQRAGHHRHFQRWSHVQVCL